MLRTILTGTAAIVLISVSVAGGAEGVRVKVETRIDVGAIEEVEIAMDGDEFVDFRGVSFLPSVRICAQLTERWSAGAYFRGAFTTEDEDGELTGVDAETWFRQLDVGAEAGFTFALNEQFSLTPKLGLSWRSYTAEGEADLGPSGMAFEASILDLDLGARADVVLSDRVSLSASVDFSWPVAADGELRVQGFGPGRKFDGDPEGGWLAGLGASVEYRLADTMSLTAGLSYEVGHMEWTWETSGGDFDGEDEMARLSVTLGAVFEF
jgi:outer membrane autotransporter protein